MTSSESFLGIDLGSSFLKVCIIDQALTAVHSAKERLPPGFYEVGNNIWPRLISSLSRLIKVEEQASGRLRGIAVSAVVPCLVAVDISRQSMKVVLSHLVPPISSKTQALDLGSRISIRRERTEHAIFQYKLDTPFSRDEYLLPLSSAIGLLLCGTLAFDVISLYELGYLEPEPLLSWGSKQARSARVPGEFSLTQAPLMGVTSDTIASSLGGGLRKKGDGLVYYGTYYCALDLRTDLTYLLSSEPLREVPYVWVVSLPHFGLLLESTLRLFNFASTADDRFAVFENFIRDSPPSTSQFSLTAELEKIFDSDGIPRLTFRGLGAQTRHKDVANALASVLGYELRRALSESRVAPQQWFAGGGGTVCTPLLQRTSDLAGIAQFKLAKSSTAYGTAILAQSKSEGSSPQLPSQDNIGFSRIVPRDWRQ